MTMPGGGASSSEAGRFSIVLYLVIWAFGVIGAAYYFIPTLDLLSSQVQVSLRSASIQIPIDWVRYFVFSIIGATFIHISLVYLSMHEMDSHPSDWRTEFPRWAMSRLEYCVRFFILLALFSIADKIWPVLQKLMDIASTGPRHLHLITGNLIPCSPEPLWVFPLSCASLFCVLLVWDVLGVWRKADHSNRVLSLMKDLFLLVIQMNSDARAAFFRSDLFGFLFWVFLTAFEFRSVAPGWVVVLFLLISPVSYIANNGWRAFRFVLLDEWRIVLPQAVGSAT